MAPVIPSQRHRPLSLVSLFVLVTVVLCLGNHTLPLIDRDEPRFAEASREMLQKGEWIVPTFNNAPRYDKPPLIYWMHIVCYRALGDNAFAARLPAALCTGATAVLLALWGARLASRATGFMAAVVYVTCLQVFVHGRAAVADPPMVLCVLASAWAGWEWLRSPASRAAAFAFWGTLALGFLAKGPIAWVPIGMVAWAARRTLRPAPDAPSQIYAPPAIRPSPLQWTTGILLMLGIICLWGIPALANTRGEFAAIGLGKHVVARSVVSMEGHGAKNIFGYLVSLPFYFLCVFPSFAPWSLWLPACLRAHRTAPTAESAFLFSGVVLTFGIFTLSRTKLPHYTLPAFPFLALLLALWWRDHRPASLFLRTTKILTGVFVLAPLLLFPAARSLSATENLLKKLLPELTRDARVALVDYEEPSLIWGVRAKIQGYPERVSAEHVEAWLAQPGERFCILTDKAAASLSTSHPLTLGEGWNFAKGRRVTLVALRNKTP